MRIEDLDYQVTIDAERDVEASNTASRLQGGVFAAVTGVTIAQPGVAAAGVFTTASGQQTFTLANTSALVTFSSYFTSSQATATGAAFASSGTSYASATVYSSATSTSFSGSSMSMNANASSSSTRY